MRFSMQSLETGPTADEIREARVRANLTQPVAAALIHVDKQTWSNWEREKRSMHPAMWELFLIKTGQRKVPAL